MVEQSTALRVEAHGLPECARISVSAHPETREEFEQVVQACGGIEHFGRPYAHSTEAWIFLSGEPALALGVESVMLVEPTEERKVSAVPELRPFMLEVERRIEAEQQRAAAA